jgi:transposase
MSYQRGIDRSQVQLFPPCIEDYVPANSAVRFIDAFVEGRDFGRLGFTHAQPAETGRPPYHPADLLKLYLYGYFNRIRSSRRLEKEAGRNVELMWLLRNLRPDFKTIADFRRDNLQPFKKLFKDFNLLCRKMGLFAAELVAIDGSKFKALNNSRKHYTEEELKELVGKIEARIDNYLKELDSQDEQSPQSAPYSATELQSKIKELRESADQYETWLKEMGEKGESEKSLTDQDSRKLKGMRGHLIGYNVQIAVDAKHDLIAVDEVVQDANDLKQLAPMALAAKEELGVEHLDVVADSGYHHADHLEECEQANIRTIVPDQNRTGGKSRGGKEVFSKEIFIYDKQNDTYTCPAQQTLPHMGSRDHRGRQLWEYYNRAACAECPLRPQCTISDFRKIARLANEEVVERAARRAEANRHLIQRRKEIVEHVFGTLRQWDHDNFLMRGLTKVRAEFSISCLVYNLRRVLNLVPLEKLMLALTGKHQLATN